MSEKFMPLYDRLPGPLRCMAASLRGLYLRHLRYGPETERIVGEALERDHWSPEHWETWQQERLVRVLHRAATKVPYYREYWQSRRRQGDRASWEELANWPILKKESLRERPEAFVAEDCAIPSLLTDHTSGTTGTPLTLWYTRAALRLWYALLEARWRRWYGVSLKDRWAIIGSQRIVPFEQNRPPFWVWTAAMKQLYMSASHARPDFLRHYLDAIRRYSIAYLYGYSSALHWLALSALDAGERPSLRLVETNAEPLYDYQRDTISRAFGCPVRETYGQAEMVCAMSECEQGRLHLWPEVGFVELLEEWDQSDQSVEPGEPGRLICTGFINEAMLLVRYEVMDMARLPTSVGACSCGRGLPQVEKVIGRLDDVIMTPDGRRIAVLDVIFGPDLHVREGQIVQETIDTLKVRVVPGKEWSKRDEEGLRSALRQRVGEMKILVEPVGRIERTWAGKLRVMVSKLADATPAAEIARRVAESGRQLHSR